MAHLWNLQCTHYKL